MPPIARLSRIAPMAMAVCLLTATPASAQGGRIVVSVASSVADAVEEIAALYRSATGTSVSVNAGGSNTLARQIVEGAPASIFLSADEAQMNTVEQAGRIVPGTRSTLLTNELAVIAPADAAAISLAHVREGRIARLALGEPAGVPAGVYARTWLEREGAWARLQSKVVPFPTVRAVLGAVEAGRVDAGVVYATDAIGARVRVVARVTAQEHPEVRISYPVALIAGGHAEVARPFLEFLKGSQARAVFDRRGFGKP